MWPGRPTSCTVVCGPGSRTRIICNWGPRHGPQTPNSRTRPGVAVSRLGIAPPESSGPRHGPQTPNSRTRPGVAVSRLGIAPPESSGPRHGPQTPNSRTRPRVAVSRLGIAPPESSGPRHGPQPPNSRTRPGVAGSRLGIAPPESSGPRHGPQTPNSRTRPGVAVSRLGIAPPESSDHRRKAAGRHTRSDIVELAALDPTKANAITGLQQNGLSSLGIVEPHRRASEQPEAAGTVHGVDAALDAADGHATRGDLHPRCVQARDRQALGRAGHVRQARREADEVHEVLRARVQPHELG